MARCEVAVSHFQGGEAIRQRLITAFIGLPLLLLLVWAANPGLFVAVLTLVALQGLHEYYAMLSSGPLWRTQRLLPWLWGSLLLAVLAAGWTQLGLVVLMFGVLLVGSLYLWQLTPQRLWPELCPVLVGWLYIVPALASCAWLRDLDYGRYWLTFALLVVMAGDSGAYFTGRRFGQRPLAPHISPNKTLEGALGGIAGSVMGGLVANVFVPFAWPLALVYSLLVGCAGQVGDLFESALKRSAGVKDSGNLLPGHGGLLDRMDSLLFAFPLLYSLLYVTGTG